MSRKKKAQYYTDEQIIFISQARQEGVSWSDLQEAFNKKFNETKNHDALRMAYNKYGNIFQLSDKDNNIKQLRDVVNTKKRSSKIAKENKTILEYLEVQEDLVDRIETVVKAINKNKFKLPKKPKADKRKKPMTMELMLSDLHYGKETPTFNLAVARKRMQHLCDTFLKELERNNKIYNVEKIIVALIGDIIESSTMHGLESARGCEFGNSRQVQEAINSIFFDMILPLAKTGLPIVVPAVTGNHDRYELKQTMNDRGEENLTYIIYKTLELLCKQSGLKNVEFLIAIKPYQKVNIYGNLAVYEHFDEAKAATKIALSSLMASRQSQLGEIIDFYRGGHFHEATEYGLGRIIINGSLPGPDSYSDTKGFVTEPSQTINSYVKTNNRPTCFYRSFKVYLV